MTRYALLTDDVILNVIECDDDTIGEFAKISGADAFAAVPLLGPHQNCEPGGKVANAKSLPPDADGKVVLGALTVARASATPAAEIAAAEAKVKDSIEAIKAAEADAKK